MQDVYHGCDGFCLSFYHRIRVFVYQGLCLSIVISVYSTVPLESILILLLVTEVRLSWVSTLKLCTCTRTSVPARRVLYNPYFSAWWMRTKLTLEGEEIPSKEPVTSLYLILGAGFGLKWDTTLHNAAQRGWSERPLCTGYGIVELSLTFLRICHQERQSWIGQMIMASSSPISRQPAHNGSEYRWLIPRGPWSFWISTAQLDGELFCSDV